MRDGVTLKTHWL